MTSTNQALSEPRDEWAEFSADILQSAATAMTILRETPTQGWEAGALADEIIERGGGNRRVAVLSIWHLQSEETVAYGSGSLELFLAPEEPAT